MFVSKFTFMDVKNFKMNPDISNDFIKSFFVL